MKDGPRFSVVIPTYNRRALVCEAVESVLRQTLAAHEIIVVVDGSPDDTAAVLRAKYPQIVVNEQVNRGLAAARNAGLARATGEWVCALDDDDLWHPDRLRRVAEYVAGHPECEALIGPCWYFSSAEGPGDRLAIGRDFAANSLEECVREADARGLAAPQQGQRLASTVESLNAVLGRNQGLYISSCVVKRKTLIRAGGACPMQVCGEDWTMLVNVARICQWHTLAQRLVFTRFHEVQMTAPKPEEDLFALALQLNVWLAGRPARERLKLKEALGVLGTFGPAYRKTVGGFYWNALRRGEFRLAGRIRAAGKLLLPRWSDRVISLIPPPLLWRYERYVLGMHRGPAASAVVRAPLASLELQDAR